MKGVFQDLIINGEYLPRELLLTQSRKRLVQSKQEWERDLYAFILEWLNEEEMVVATTSGSTGTPKKIQISKLSMINSARLTGQYLGFKRKQSALLCLSTNFIAGKMMVVRAFVWGLNLIPVEPSGHPLTGLEQDIDYAAMVPLQVYNSLDDSKRLEQIDQLIIGGGVVDQELHNRLKSLRTRFYSTYGMTETVSHVAMKPLNGPQASENFHALGHIRFTTDVRGCLVIHAPHLLDDPLVTNDVVRLESPREFEWLGRYDNVINSGGIKLFPEKVEQKLMSLISGRFFVGGLPDPRLGQRLVLVVEGEPWSEEKQQLLKASLQEHLDRFEVPREIIFLPQFEETPTGKIRRTSILNGLGS